MFMYTAEDDNKTEIRLSFLETNVIRQERTSDHRHPRHSSTGSTPMIMNNKDYKEFNIQIVPVSFKTEPTIYPLKNRSEDLYEGDNLRHSRLPKKNYNVSQLYKAIYDGRVDDVRFSLHYINVKHSRDEYGCTPIIATMLSKGGRSKRLEMLDLFIKEGLDPRLRDDVHHRTAFGWGCYHGRVTELQKLADALEGDVNYEERDVEGNTYLLLAILSKNFETVRFVVNNMEKLNISMDATNNMGITPYILARKMGLRDIADLLNQKKNISKQKSDDTVFRTPREWSILGQVERLAQDEQGGFNLYGKRRGGHKYSGMARRTHSKRYLPKLMVSHEDPEQLESVICGEEVDLDPMEEKQSKMIKASDAPINPPSSQLLKLSTEETPVPHDLGKRIKQQFIEETPTEWLHDVFLLWSGQHNPSYRRPAVLKKAPSSGQDYSNKAQGHILKPKNSKGSKGKRPVPNHTPNLS